MPALFSQKVKIKEGFTLLTIHAPRDFKQKLELLSKDVKISANAKKYRQIHWFVANKTQLERELNKVLPLIKDDVVCWTYYPKGTSKMQTDLTRDKGWDSLLAHGELTWISLVSFDETWSAFGCRLKTEAGKKKAAQPEQRAIFDYIDPKTKTIRLPGDLAAMLKKNEKQDTFFNSLSFSNRKEYVEWVITAQREATRNQRLKDIIERLKKGWKNLAGR